MHERVDVVVVGAGPGGAAAATTAAARGLRAICVDKARFPRDKTCGDGLTAGALRLLERLGLSRAALDAAGYFPVQEVMLVGPSGRRVSLPLPTDGDHAGVIARSALDAALVAHARSRGADVRDGIAVRDITSGGDDVMVDMDDGTCVTARHVVAADGHWSAVRRLVDRHREPEAPRTDLGEWHAARQYFEGVDDNRLWVIFEPDLLPGYAWVFPLPDGRANVGYGVLRAQRRRGRDLRALWPALLERPSLRAVLGPAAKPLAPVRAWPIPTRFEPATLAAGSVLFAGDAARVVDPMTGEGIAQAIETGMLAIDAIAAGGDADAVATRYRRSVSRALGRDLRFASALQALLTHPAGARAAIAAAGCTAWTRRNFARWLFEDYPRALVLTPDRWHRHAFTAAGAYAVR